MKVIKDIVNIKNQKKEDIRILANAKAKAKANLKE